MSLEYYLFCRKSFNNIISQLNYMIETYEGIKDYTIDEMCVTEEIHTDLFAPDYNINFFIEKKIYTEQLKKVCNEKILKLCKHNFVEDLIDISPEISKHIRYCTVCEFTDDTFSLSPTKLKYT
jgi:hypothetical protein